MIDRIKQSYFARLSARFFGWLSDEMAPALLRRRIIGLAVIASLVSAVYWGLVASDRYVSEAQVVVQRTDLPGGQAMDFAGLLGTPAAGRSDQLLLRSHLLSVDMLKKLDAELNLRAHYSDERRDPLSRLWFADASIEWFYRHYLSRISIEFDDYAGVVLIKANAYTPDMAHSISAMLVREGEAFMNTLARNLAREQVVFLEKQTTQMHERAMAARQVMLDFQNKEGIVSPQAAAASANAIIAKLEGQRSELETQRSALQAYLVPTHPSLVQINQQIAAAERQIKIEQAKLAAPAGKPLNRVMEEFQRLEMEAAFVMDAYKTSLVALEKGRIEATRTIKKLSVVQAPTQPEYPLEPRRFYNALVFMLFAMLFAGVAHLLAAIVRDHKD